MPPVVNGGAVVAAAVAVVVVVVVAVVVAGEDEDEATMGENKALTGAEAKINHLGALLMMPLSVDLSRRLL